MKAYNGFSSEQRYRALAWIKAQYAAGERKPPTACDACGQDRGIFDAHSEDYSEPFGAHTGRFGLCFRCHMMIHLRWRHSKAWDVYRATVARGGRLSAVYRRAFPQIVSECERMVSGDEMFWRYRLPPSWLPLDEIHRGEHDPREKHADAG